MCIPIMQRVVEVAWNKIKLVIYYNETILIEQRLFLKMIYKPLLINSRERCGVLNSVP